MIRGRGYDVAWLRENAWLKGVWLRGGVAKQSMTVDVSGRNVAEGRT